MTAAYAALLALLPAATAGDIYVNGVRADDLRGVELRGVNIRFDERGDAWIDAPGYRVAVEDGAPPQAPAADVPAARYWLVTEDHASTGQVVDVVVNGTLVRKIRSGQGQLILDLKPWLRPGPNTIILNAIPGRDGGGGPLKVYVGTGRNEDGTVVLDDPQIRFTRQAAEATQSASRTFTLDVR